MGDTKRGTADMMHVARIDDPIWLGAEANRMAREMVQGEGRMGEKLDAVAWRIQRNWGVDASIIKQGWQRPPRDMKVSRWMNLFQGYQKWKARGARAHYEQKREAVADHGHPALLRLADFVAGRVAGDESTTEEDEEAGRPSDLTE